MKRTILVASALMALCLGLPWTFEGPGLEVPSNAVVLYERASASLPPLDDSIEEEIRSVLDQGWHGAHPTLDRYLDENRVALSWIERGSRIEHSDFLKGAASASGRASLTGIPPRGLDVRSVWRFADLLLLEAARHHARGEDGEALENYVALFRMSRHYAHDRNANLISTAIAMYLQGLAIQPVAQLLHRPSLEDHEWRELLSFLRRLSAAPIGLERAFTNELTTLRRAYAEEEWELDADQLLEFHAELERLGDEFVEYFRVARRTGDVEPYQAASARLHTEAELGEYGPGSVARVALAVGLPDVESMLARERVEEARLAMLVVFVAAELHREEHHRTLDSLDELVPEFLPEVPRDPFADGAPLRLARSGKNRWFYSVGPDGVDQEGQVVLADGALEGEGDLVVASRHDH